MARALEPAVTETCTSDVPREEYAVLVTAGVYSRVADPAKHRRRRHARA
jgi:hypothetical protein